MPLTDYKNPLKPITMGYMKYLSQVQDSAHSLMQFKAAVLVAKKNNLNYAFVDHELFTLDQLEGMIAIIEANVQKRNELKQKSKQKVDDQVHNEGHID